MNDNVTVYQTGGTVPEGLAPMEDAEQLLDDAEELHLLKTIARKALWLQAFSSHLQASTNDAAWALVDLKTALDAIPPSLRKEILEFRPGRREEERGRDGVE